MSHHLLRLTKMTEQMSSPIFDPDVQRIDDFYSAFWSWWEKRYRANSDTLQPFRRGHEGWAGTRTTHGPVVRAGVAFSGDHGPFRVVKAELYVEDAMTNTRWTNEILPGMAAGAAPFSDLWTQLDPQVHWHPGASKRGKPPGVCTWRDAQGWGGHNPVTVPPGGVIVPEGDMFGNAPVSAVSNAVSIGRFGKAGRVATFHAHLFDLRKGSDVELAGVWIRGAITVLEGVLAALDGSERT